MTGEEKAAPIGATPEDATRQAVREVLLSGGVSLDSVIERFFEEEPAR